MSAVKTHLLDIEMVKPLIVCEGSDDVMFLQTVAALMGLSLQSVQLHASSSLCSSEELKRSFEAIATHVGATTKVRYLRDLDFRVGNKPGPSEFFWDLPTIESYIFVDYCEQHKNDARSPLAFMLDAELSKAFALTYVNSFRSQNRDDEKLIVMLNNWSTAVAAASQVPVTSEAILAVARVVHGHTWVKQVMGSSTTQFIASLTASILASNPQLGTLMNTLVKYVHYT